MRLKTDTIAWNEVGENVIVLDLVSSNYFSTNASGTLLFQLLTSGASPDELVTALVERFCIDTGTAERDVDAFLTELAQARLLDREN
jgi:Coenzyme PQQ synthesis protein D (PqqD)